MCLLALHPFQRRRKKPKQHCQANKTTTINNKKYQKNPPKTKQTPPPASIGKVCNTFFPKGVNTENAAAHKVESRAGSSVQEGFSSAQRRCSLAGFPASAAGVTHLGYRAGSSG